MAIASTVTALAYLISEALVIGTTWKELMDATKDTGIVPPEMWADMMDEMDEARKELGLT